MKIRQLLNENLASIFPLKGETLTAFPLTRGDEVFVESFSVSLQTLGIDLLHSISDEDPNRSTRDFLFYKIDGDVMDGKFLWEAIVDLEDYIHVEEHSKEHKITINKFTEKYKHSKGAVVLWGRDFDTNISVFPNHSKQNITKLFNMFQFCFEVYHSTKGDTVKHERKRMSKVLAVLEKSGFVLPKDYSVNYNGQKIKL